MAIAIAIVAVAVVIVIAIATVSAANNHPDVTSNTSHSRLALIQNLKYSHLGFTNYLHNSNQMYRIVHQLAQTIQHKPKTVQNNTKRSIPNTSETKIHIGFSISKSLGHF